MASDVESFATVDELEDGWHPLLGSERTRAEALLARATRLIRAQCPGWRIAEETNPGICADVCCAMTQRAMATSGADIPDGVKQMSQTTGSFQDSWTFDNPSGDLYLRDEERRALNPRRGRAFTITYAHSRVE
ncbi:phage protein Gp19/Gp15/Gp42 [Bifidobacterium pseudolongum subsp. globosum]|uniref:Gp19/Gp15/Gp42 family protein n=1 Tax=Bifidobacterium pseudolongum TaxID=1694 RepID=UPI0010220351|nr:Gp19/Gp15/Gp42 family protein [Bifidobacterium pseudolongum]RYQ59977.1 phage protein Gp19/Gp15/Gp42 [Bifidobacterium pseudolongum subsp. globosum]